MALALAGRVARLDQHFSSARPHSFELSVGGVQTRGRYVHARGASELWHQYDPRTERVATLREVVLMRLAAFDQLLAAVPALGAHVDALVAGDTTPQLPAEARTAMVDRIHSIWRIRLTTSTHMVRAPDEHGADTVFFFTGSAFRDPQAMRRAIEGELSDGGIRYDDHAIAEILRGTPAGSRLPYEAYVAARGGNFTGTDFATHPIFMTSVGDADLFMRYVYALSVLNLGDFYNPGIHSGWRPGEMKAYHGRPVALGFKGEAFYPPNNSTVDHSAAVVALDFALPVT